MLNCDRIDVMLARAQITLAFTLVFSVIGLTVLLVLYHGDISAVMVTLVSSIVSQMMTAMILAVNYFLARSRPHTPADPTSADLQVQTIATTQTISSTTPTENAK